MTNELNHDLSKQINRMTKGGGQEAVGVERIFDSLIASPLTLLVGYWQEASESKCDRGNIAMAMTL